MSAASRQVRRRADRRRAKDGFYVDVPPDLTAWATAASAATDLGEDQKRITAGIARLLRRAMVLDGVRTGEQVWIGYDDLGRVS